MSGAANSAVSGGNKLSLTNAALAFRGYNITNLGRSHELLQQPSYRPIIQRHLRDASLICSEVLNRGVHLESRIERQEEPTLEEYGESIALIVAMEHAQLEILAEVFRVDYRTARIATGFSLGEISALVAGGVYSFRDALQIPLAMSADCIELARDVTMGVVFSRGEVIPLERVKAICVEINLEGRGVIGVSAHLSPNSLILLGSQQTISRFRERLSDVMPGKLALRENNHRWPPLHTPIVWNRNIPNRAGVLMHTLPGGMRPPQPDILSMVTGTTAYQAFNSRELIGAWIDHTQRLWDVINELLVMGIEKIVHLGPGPNIIPATFERLAANVELQTRGSRSMRAVSFVARRPWLNAILPRRAALLRAPLVKHIILEDWLLQHAPK